jgi:CRP/FNR family transcriptional regulator, cyclic AMP receptor protein
VGKTRLDKVSDLRPLRKEHLGEGLAEALKESPLFSVLDERQLEAIVESAKLREFDPNETVVHEGETAAGFYVIIEGQVEVRLAGRTLAKLGRGQFFGETTILADQTRSADVVAALRTRCLTLSMSELRGLITSNPAVALKILEESTRRYRLRSPEPQTTDATGAQPASAAKMVMEFKSDKAKSLFEYLVKSFIDDYMGKKYAMERSGWRGLADVARGIKVSPSSLYGKRGGASPMVGELVRRGLVETRIFPGERGRGGEVTRVRVAYEKEPIMEYVKSKVRSG